MVADSVYDIGDSIQLEGIVTVLPTRGSIEKDAVALTVADPFGWNPADPIVVAGAGPLAADLVTTVQSIAGYVLTLAIPAGNSVVGADVGKPAVATVTLNVRPPAGAVSALTAAEVSTGRYRGTFVASVEGEHFYRFGATGTVVAQGERRFTVRERRVP